MRIFLSVEAEGEVRGAKMEMRESIRAWRQQRSATEVAKSQRTLVLGLDRIERFHASHELGLGLLEVAEAIGKMFELLRVISDNTRVSARTCSQL